MRQVRERIIVLAFTAVGALLAGAVVNLAVAWLCAAYVNPAGAEPTLSITTLAPDAHDVASVFRRFGHTRVERARFIAIDIDPVSRAIRSTTHHPDAPGQSEMLAGWPLRSLAAVNHGRILIMSAGSEIRLSKRGRGGIEDAIELAPFQTRGTLTMWRGLPYRPIWLGFALNSIFYALLLALLLSVAYRIRGAMRRRRGLCPACAYPIGASPVCTECGHALTQTA